MESALPGIRKAPAGVAADEPEAVAETAK